MSSASKKTGRPSKLTPKIKDALLVCLSLGNYVEVACEFVGISKNTYYEWIKKAEQAREQGRTNEYTEFQDELTRAQGAAEINMVKKISKADDWKAQAWLLSRRHNARWGKPDEAPSITAKATQDDDKGLTIEVVYGAPPQEPDEGENG